jgi:quinol monooxygenase YgiN/enamine deaminase RidA (YjgF/YER057c/UK114 family)
MKCCGLLACFALVAFCLCANGQSVGYVNSDSVRKARGYSHAVVLPTLGIVKTSGIIGTTPTGELVTTSARAQIRQTFMNLRHILEASGATVADVDEIETFLTDSAYFKDYVMERVEFFRGRVVPPISKTYYTKGLINPHAIVEINVTATVAKDPSARPVFHVTAVLEAKEGSAERLAELLTANVQPSRNEKGCLQYDLFRGGASGHTFVLHERWTDRAAFDLHFSMPYMKELSKRIKELVKDSSIHVVEKIGE